MNEHEKRVTGANAAKTDMGMANTLVRLPERQSDLSMVGPHRDALLQRIAGFGEAAPKRIRLGDNLELIRRLGAGGMGTVWEAEHTGLRIRVAVKRLQRELAPSDPSRLRFTREARAAASVKHPHVVDILDVSTDDDGNPYLVMELLDGEPLSDVLRREGPLPWARARALLGQLVDALHCAHANDVIHRDLKPSNIMIMEPGTAHESCKIIDFGLAKQQTLEPEAQEITHTGDVFGSPGYMSPEQLRGEVVDARSDIYSLGCVAFEMLTGRRPFAGPSLAELMVQHLTQPPPALEPLDAPQSVAPAVRALVLRALGKEPRDRQGRMAELAEELLRIDRSEGSWWARTRAVVRARRRPVAIAAGGVACCVVASVAVGLAALLTRPAEPDVDAPAGDRGSTYTQELARPIEQRTPQWPARWIGADLGLPEPSHDEAADRTGVDVPDPLVAVWAADLREARTYRIIADRGDAHALSRHAVRQGLTLGHTVDDPASAERVGRAGDPSTGRVFHTQTQEFPLRAVGTVHLDRPCTGVQVGPVHVLTSAHCLWTLGAAFPKDEADWRAGAWPDEDAQGVGFVRVYVPQPWPQNARAGMFDWAVAITERQLGDEYFGVTALPDRALVASRLHHKGFPMEHDPECEARSPTSGPLGLRAPWGNAEPLEVTARALRAPSPVSGWSVILGTAQVSSIGHGGGPYYYYDDSNRPVVVGIHRGACSEAEGGTAAFCGWEGPWHCGIEAARPSQALRLEPDALYGHIVPILTWWGVDDSGQARCLLDSGC
ncbi:MAG: serine/threonine-protein kinase [Myxococcota bacterium]